MEGFGLAQWHRARRGAVTPKIFNSGEQDFNLCAHVGTDNPFEVFKKLVGSLGIPLKQLFQPASALGYAPISVQVLGGTGN